jgi:hypothetical protein
MAQGINVVGYDTMTVSNAGAGLPFSTGCTTTGLPDRAKRVFITSETDAVRWRADGTAPAANEGHYLAKDDSISFTGADYRQLLEKMLFIRVTNNATLKVTFFD